MTSEILLLAELVHFTESEGDFLVFRQRIYGLKRNCAFSLFSVMIPGCTQLTVLLFISSLPPVME
jgi:hypothetical protein